MRRVERLNKVTRKSASSAAMVLLRTDCGTPRSRPAAVKELVSTARQKNLIARSLSMSCVTVAKVVAAVRL
jgi:hypothetical protein